MDSPTGPTLANAFLCHHEKIWLNERPSQFKHVVYRHYVDYVFVLFKSKEHLKSGCHCPKNVCLTESLLKMINNAFYFILKALFVINIFKFLSRLFSYVEKND